MIICHIEINSKKWHQFSNIKSKIDSITNDIIANSILKKYLSKNFCLEIFFSLVDEIEMKKINNQFLKNNYSTNVLSFANLDENYIRKIGISKLIKENKKLILGDIVLDFDTIKNESIQQQKNFIDHLTHLIIHAILHLIGFDHQEDSMAEEMEQMEIEILKKLDIKNPYC